MVAVSAKRMLNWRLSISVSHGGERQVKVFFNADDDALFRRGGKLGDQLGRFRRGRSLGRQLRRFRCEGTLGHQLGL